MSSIRGQGLVVAGFPANDFKSQEPGTNEEIQSFCTTNFGVKFPMFSKISGGRRQTSIRCIRRLTAAQPKASASPKFHFARS